MPQVVEFPDFFLSRMSIHFIPYKKDKIRNQDSPEKIQTVGKPTGLHGITTQKTSVDNGNVYPSVSLGCFVSITE
jgi:hypothetical protein